ncbi:MAG: hypothetical protein R6W83_12560, partial [Cryobacterium sp.]
AKNALAQIAARTISRPSTGTIAVIVPPEGATTAPAEVEATGAVVTPAPAATLETDTDAPARSGRSRGDRSRGDRGRNRRDAGNRDAGNRDAGSRGATPDQSGADTFGTEQAVTTPVVAPETHTAAAATDAPRVDPAPVPDEAAAAIAILDIPVVQSGRSRRPVSQQDTEKLLGSVLDSLPEPKQPGQGRARSRRVTTAGGSTSSAQPIVIPGNDSAH